MYHDGGLSCGCRELLLLSVVVAKCCETVSLPNADGISLSGVVANCWETVEQNGGLS